MFKSQLGMAILCAEGDNNTLSLQPRHVLLISSSKFDRQRLPFAVISEKRLSVSGMCFPLVITRTQTISQLKIGDQVLAVDRTTGAAVYDTIYLTPTGMELLSHHM